MGVGTVLRRGGTGHRVTAIVAVAATVLAGTPAATAAPAPSGVDVPRTPGPGRAGPACGPGRWVSITLATGKPGGTRRVFIELTDAAHGTKASGACRRPGSGERSRS
ncbi:hypothetical protein [Amycolatopsis sp. MtRt-6]|uniref:hypothetical protein n=1 Tax=Amycolatopsis sp. MtRt-6 TaxID=2792782 RepID=UPI001A8D5E65|nr:hypothetical protein [Amycolatopsis sp. MtRt-6]